MSMLNFRADFSRTDEINQAILWFSNWFGGPTLAKISNCPIHGTDKRLTVYITGHPDTWFSVPAATRYRGKYIAGYVTYDSELGHHFRPMDAYKYRLS